MRLPDLGRLAIGAPGDDLVEKLARLTFAEVASRTLADNRPLFPLGLAWEDGAQSSVEGPGHDSAASAPCVLRLRASPPEVDVLPAQGEPKPQQYPCAEENIDQVYWH